MAHSQRQGIIIIFQSQSCPLITFSAEDVGNLCAISTFSNYLFQFKAMNAQITGIELFMNRQKSTRDITTINIQQVSVQNRSISMQNCSVLWLYQKGQASTNPFLYIASEGIYFFFNSVSSFQFCSSQGMHNHGPHGKRSSSAIGTGNQAPISHQLLPSPFNGAALPQGADGA